MKLKQSLLASGLLLASLTACHPTTDDLRPAPPDGATPIGQPTGQLTSQVIGPQGGSLQSADGQVQLDIPAGALAKATTISILPITNQAPNGLGTAYRFAPDGTVFAKPATLTLRYNTAAVSVNDPDLLGVSYQTPDHHWQAVRPLQVDTAGGQLKVAMPHFSDWSAYELAKLSVLDLVGKEYLDLGTSTTLEVEALVEPLGYADGPPLEVDYSQLSWSVVGGGANGSLKVTGDKAVYTAPAQYPAQNPITIMAEVPFKSSQKKAYLLKRILIGRDYFTTSFGGAAFSWSQMGCSKKDGLLIINGNNGGNQSLNIMLNLTDAEAVVGSYPYTDGFKAGTALAEFAASYGAYDGYVSWMPQCGPDEGPPPPPLISGGQVTITQWEVVNGSTYLKGSLTGNFLNLPGPCPAQLKQKSVQAEFRLKLAP